MIDWRQHLTRNPDISTGQLCAAGTRIPVTVILANLADGLSREEIQTQYPSLLPAHIDAALSYAAELAEEQLLLPLGGL